MYCSVGVIRNDGLHWQLLLRRYGQAKAELPGGWAQPVDDSLEHAAARILKLQTGMEVLPSDLRYLGSTRNGRLESVWQFLCLTNYFMTPGEYVSELFWFPIAYCDLEPKIYQILTRLKNSNPIK